MQLAPIDVLGYARWLTLIGCFGYAAWMDKVERRVANEHWIAWSKPLIFIWVLEFLVREADWTIYASAAGVLAYASVSVIGRPTLSDIRAGNPLDIAVATWYLFGIAGFIGGGLQYASTGLTPLFDGTADEQTILWFEVMITFAMVLLFEFAWRLRLLHGGADAKAMMWVAMLLPSWYTLSPIWEFSSAGIRSPPVISLFIWGGLSFLILPFILMVINLKRGDLKGPKDLRMAWHSLKMPLDIIPEKHVWLLDRVVEKPDGTTTVHSRTRPPRRTPTNEQLAEQISELKEQGQNNAWVSLKFPLITMLFPAVIPLFLFGDPLVLLFEKLL